MQAVIKTMFGTLGGPELFLIFVVALIIFGPRKLPEIGKSMGKMMAEFRKASNEFRSTIENEVEAEKIRDAMRIEPFGHGAPAAAPPGPAAAQPEPPAPPSSDPPAADATAADATVSAAVSRRSESGAPVPGGVPPGEPK